MNTIWVVVADSSHARCFHTVSPIGTLKEKWDITHEASRLAERALTTDRPGRTFDSVGGGRHAMEEPTGVHEATVRAFAREIAGRLDSARQRHAFERLYLIAAPDFLGHLREALSDSCRALLIDSIDKNVVKQDLQAIRAHLPERL